MDILTAITTAISSLKAGYEIKKLAGNLDSEVQQSELRIEIRKLQETLIEVQDVLLNAKREILENRELIDEKDKEIKNLKNLLEANPSIETDDLTDESIKVMKVFAQDDNITVAFIAESLQISEQRVKYHLDILVEKDLVNINSVSFSLTKGAFYYLTKHGRKFMFEKNLI